MFALVHFSRVFPYIHPYLFPLEASGAAEPVAAGTACPGAKTETRTGSEDAAGPARAGKVRRLKSLHRRHLRNQRSDALTYSGTLGHAAG
jgi:hypothetical protein